MPAAVSSLIVTAFWWLCQQHVSLLVMLAGGCAQDISGDAACLVSDCLQSLNPVDVLVQAKLVPPAHAELLHFLSAPLVHTMLGLSAGYIKLPLDFAMVEIQMAIFPEVSYWLTPHLNIFRQKMGSSSSIDSSSSSSVQQIDEGKWEPLLQVE